MLQPRSNAKGSLKEIFYSKYHDDEKVFITAIRDDKTFVLDLTVQILSVILVALTRLEHYLNFALREFILRYGKVSTVVI